MADALSQQRLVSLIDEYLRQLEVGWNPVAYADRDIATGIVAGVANPPFGYVADARRLDTAMRRYYAFDIQASPSTAHYVQELHYRASHLSAVLVEVRELVSSEPAAPGAVGQDGPWSRPKGPKDWGKVFGFSADTFKRRCAAGKIRHKKLSSRKYLVHVDDIPASVPTQAKSAQVGTTRHK
jgi:hypothetical protein